MTKDDEREVQRKLRILQHAEKIGLVARTCRYFGIGRASFDRRKRAYEHDGEAGLVNAKTIPKNPPNQTPPEVAEKVLHLRRKYHLGPEQIMRASRALSRHQIVRCNDILDPKTQRLEQAPAQNAPSQSSHQALQ